MSESFPVLTPEELAQLRQEFPNMPEELSRQFEQASQFVGEGIAADGVEFTPGTGQRGDGVARARPRSYAENDRKQAIANMDGAGKARMDRYYAAVTDAMQQPVIAVRAAADMAAERLGNPELAQAISDRLAMSYESGLMSPADYLKEIAVQPFLSKIDELREQGANIPDSLVEAQVGAFTEQAARHAQTAADFLGQRDMHPENAGPAILVRQAVMDHAPRGKYAAYGHRTYSENAQVPKDKGDPNYYLTPEGAQNHQALRVAELFSANDEGYAPAAGFSQAMRMVTPFVTDGDRAVKEFVQTGSLPYISEGTPGGKFDYAADLYARGAQGDRQQVYAEDGTPKFYAYDPTQQMGLGNAFMNTSFPYARAMNNTAPVREMAMHAGEAIEGRDYTPTIENLRRLRRESKAITPLVPDGFDPKQHRELGEKLDTADSRMDGWASAFAGPKFADAQNAVLGTKTPRTYLSPAMDTLLNVPAESFSDPINLGVNLTLPAIGGSLTGGVKGAVKGLAKSPLRMLDDAVEESAENMALGPATTGIAGFFMPEEDNLMMRGWKFGDRQGGPNDPGYDQEVEKRAVQARQDQMDAADEYGKARSKARYDSKPRPIAEVRW